VKKRIKDISKKPRDDPKKRNLSEIFFSFLRLFIAPMLENIAVVPQSSRAKLQGIARRPPISMSLRLARAGDAGKRARTAAAKPAIVAEVCSTVPVSFSRAAWLPPGILLPDGALFPLTLLLGDTLFMLGTSGTLCGGLGTIYPPISVEQIYKFRN
jgi:hypothetical protein